MQKKPLAFWVFLSLSLLALAVSLTAFSNVRVAVDRVDISVPMLPQELEGYTVLVVGDLHNKTFQKGQEGISKAIGAARYDVVLFVGDMTIRGEEEAAPFYALVDAFTKGGKPMYYSRGEHDPQDFVRVGDTTSPSPYLQGLLDRGVQLLDRPYRLKVGEQAGLWLWPLPQVATDVESAAETAQANMRDLEESTQPEDLATVAYNQRLLEGYQAHIDASAQVVDGDIHIAAGHYPLTPAQVELLQAYDGPRPGLADIDLVVAGHYHAGQWRAPILGAVYIPAPGLPRGGWFPDQELVVGAKRMSGVMQYITRGLGSTGPKPFRFRLFDTPEIALLRLTSKVS